MLPCCLGLLLTTWVQIKRYLVELFTEGIKREEDKENRHALLSTILVFVYEHLPDTSKEIVEFRFNIVAVLLRELATVSTTEWPVESKIMLLKVVSHMAQLAGPVVVTKDFACTVAIQLCTFMSIQIQKNERKDKAIDEVDQCLHCVASLVDPSLRLLPRRSILCCAG
jgi:hypothetical protein